MLQFDNRLPHKLLSRVSRDARAAGAAAGGGGAATTKGQGRRGNASYVPRTKDDLVYLNGEIKQKQTDARDGAPWAHRACGRGAHPAHTHPVVPARPQERAP